MRDEATLDELAEASESAPDRGDDKEQSPSESRFWGITPRGWELVKGSEVYDVNPNLNPDEEPNSYIEMDALDTELPWPRYFGERNVSEYSGKTFTTGDTLFARITPCTENGKAALVPKMDTRVGIGSTEYAVLSPKPDRILPWYLYYVAKSHPIHDYAISRMRGSTGRQRVPFSVFRRELDIALPPIEEQRKIASVLNTVDQAIQKAKSLIQQTKCVRNGLRQNAFQSGINTEGKFRNLAENEVQETRIGEIPQEWDFVQLNEVCSEVVDCLNTTPEYSNQGIRVILTSEIEDGRYKLEDAPYVSEEVYKERIRRIEPKSDDVVFTREAPIGEAFKIPEGQRLCLGQRTMQLRVKDGVLSPDYLLEMLYSNKMQSWFERVAVGSTTKHMRVEDVEQMKVPVPSIDEQSLIASLLRAYRNSIEKNMEYVDQLKRLKQGLMQDLLSGGVRITNKDIELVDEVLQHG